MIRRVVVLLVLTACLPALAAAAQSGTASVTGQVLDQSGAAVPNAVIAIHRFATGFERRVETDSEGTFSVAELAPGDYEVTATSAGFAVAVQRVTLRAGESRRLPLQLRVGGLTEDVVVVAGEIAGSHERLRRLPGSVDIVDGETLDKSRVMTTSEALRKAAGVHVRDEE